MSTILKSTAVKQEKKGKGNFFTWLGLGVGTVVSRTWKFGPGKKHTVVLEHDCMTGRRQVWLNKKLVHNQTVFPDRSFEVFVNVDGKQGKIQVANKLMSLQIHYHFYYDGEEQVSRMFDSSCRTSLESVLTVSVPDFEVEDGNAQFVVEAKSARSGTKVRFKKRFSDFVDLYQHVQAAFAGSHLSKTVPKPPPRRFRFFSNHNDPVFLDKRRVGLETFIQQLITLPRIASDQHILEFFEPFLTASKQAAGGEVDAGGGGGAVAAKSPTTKKNIVKKKKKKKKKTGTAAAAAAAEEDVEKFDEEAVEDEAAAAEEGANAAEAAGEGGGDMFIDPDDI